MTTYDFDSVISRRNTGSLKWNVGPQELPMWVADMDFQTAPEIREALQKRLDHGIFGYTEPDEDWTNAYVSWWSRRHHFSMDPQWLIFCTGVVPAISSMVRKLTTPNENVVIQTPVYNIFFNSILNNGCRVLESPLIYEEGAYRIDFDDLERKLADPQTSLMILCNPHNPIGKIWTAGELEKIGDLAVRYGVTVISDEIHCDITIPGREYVPFASVSDNCRKCSVTCIAPTKCFNMAGLQTAAVCVPEPFLRHKVWRGLNTDEVAEPNAFAVPAAVAAFTRGEEWLNALNCYLADNRKFTVDFIRKEIPELSVVDGEATYLVWIDISRLPVPEGEDPSEYVAERIRRSTGLYLTAGSEYGAAGQNFLRLNTACPRSILSEGLSRLKCGVEAILCKA